MGLWGWVISRGCSPGPSLSQSSVVVEWDGGNLTHGTCGQVVLFRGNHSVDRWPSETSARNLVSLGLLAGIERGFGFLASFPLLMLCPSLGMYSPPWVSAASLSNRQGPAHTPPLGSPPSCPFSHLFPITSFHSLPLFCPTHTYTHRLLQLDFLKIVFFGPQIPYL